MMIAHYRRALASSARQCAKLYSSSAAAASAAPTPTPSSPPAAESPQKHSQYIVNDNPGLAKVPKKGEEIEVSPHVKDLANQIARLPLADVVDLNTILRKQLKIKDTPMMPPAMLAMHKGVAQSSEELKKEKQDAKNAEKKEEKRKASKLWKVKLTGFNTEKKVDLIKHLRTVIANINLVQAKKFIESAPQVVKDELPEADADKLMKELEKFGATCVKE